MRLLRFSLTLASIVAAGLNATPANAAHCPPVGGAVACFHEGAPVFGATLYSTDVDVSPRSIVVGSLDRYAFTQAGVTVILPCVTLAAGSNPCQTAGGVYDSPIATLAVDALQPTLASGAAIATVAICEAQLTATVLGVGLSSAPALKVCGTP